MAGANHHYIEVNGRKYLKSAEKATERFVVPKSLKDAFAQKCSALGLDRHVVWTEMMNQFIKGDYDDTFTT